jgi:hypothetical protein
MRAGKPSGCHTPATEVEAQLFGGGIEGSFPVLLEFGYDNEVPVKRLEGILAYHVFELHEDGSITAWKSYRIGRGKKFSKTDLDKLYTHSTEQTPTTFPQGATEATFDQNAGKSVDTFEPKIEMSATRKRKVKHARSEATEARAEARQEKLEEAQAALDKVVSDRAPFQCMECDRRFAREATMDGHMCEVSEETQSAIQQSESSDASKKLPFEVPTTVPVSPATSSHEGLLQLLMGHGLQMGRSVTVLDDAVKRILEIQFQLGVEHNSNRKGVLEMVEECAKTMATLMAPAIYEVNSWLSCRLAKAKKSKETDTGEDAAATKRQTTKSPREKRQEDAAIMKADQKASLKDKTKQHLFLAKYLGILLIKDGVTMIVTAATFSDPRSMWLLTATKAKQHTYDDRIYIADPECIATETIGVSVQRSGLATYIRNFNGLKKPLI